MDTLVALVLVLGTVIVGLVLTHLGVGLYASLVHLAQNHRHERIASRLLLERIEIAKQERTKREQARGAWEGYRKFVVDRKIHEADNIYSFYLRPHDGKSLPPFQPGQFLTFSLRIPDEEKPRIRCYSLSDAPNPDFYRISVKRLLPPPGSSDVPAGVGSNFLCGQVEIGDILDVKAPSGKFTCDLTRKRPAVFIAGGVGITPFLSMLNTIAQARCDRPVWLFYGTRHGREPVQKEWLRRLSQEHGNIRIIMCYSDPDEHDVHGEDYDHRGRVSLDVLTRHLKVNNYVFFICGPSSMMTEMKKQLSSKWKVPAQDIITEAFNSKTVPKPETKKLLNASKAKVTLAKTKTDLVWDGSTESILELAERKGVTLEAGCRTGSCGTCQVALRSGSIEYTADPDFEVATGCCLTCIGRPAGDVVLDA